MSRILFPYSVFGVVGARFAISDEMLRTGRHAPGARRERLIVDAGLGKRMSLAVVRSGDDVLEAVWFTVWGRAASNCLRCHVGLGVAVKVPCWRHFGYAAMGWRIADRGDAFPSVWAE